MNPNTSPIGLWKKTNKLRKNKNSMRKRKGTQTIKNGKHKLILLKLNLDPNIKN